MGQFDDIRPYHDHEVAAVLQRLLGQQEFLGTIAKYSLPRLSRHACWLARMLVRHSLASKVRNINSVTGLQKLVAPYVDKTIRKATDGFSYTGLEQLEQSQPCLFISNHRDIVMDPAYVNYALYLAGFATPRLAIGDNLLQREFISDLMRLNKSFIVRRSVSGRREKLQAFIQLSAYINHSIRNEHSSIWIAQAEGRAKDGNDRTDSAILKMFGISRRELDFADSINQLRLVPVSISYEYDPCDLAKARELYIRATTGSYSKSPGEDDASIALGITGYKGRVHLSFAAPLQVAADCDAKLCAADIDQIIWRNYRLFPVHYLAWHSWQERDHGLAVPAAEQLFSSEEISQAQQYLQQRMAACPQKQQPYLIMQYAYPLQNQYQQQAATDQARQNTRQA